MAMTKRQKTTNARKNAEALKAQRKQNRMAKAKSAMDMGGSDKKRSSGIKKSAKRK